MKAILISVQPQWVEKILNGIKKDEIRKGTAIGKAINRLIKEQGVAPMLIYCTKRGGYLHLENDGTWSYSRKQKYTYVRNGKVAARFNATADKFEWDSCGRDNDGYWLENGNKLDLKPTCLSYEELFDYIKGGEGTDIHINDLEIFDKPKELSDFEHQVVYENIYTNEKRYLREPLRKAPRSWCYIEI